MTDITTPETDNKVYFCSFCAQSMHQALAMIYMPHGVNICNYCVGECAKLMAERHGIFCQPRVNSTDIKD